MEGDLPALSARVDVEWTLTGRVSGGLEALEGVVKIAGQWAVGSVLAVCVHTDRHSQLLLLDAITEKVLFRSPTFSLWVEWFQFAVQNDLLIFWASSSDPGYDYYGAIGAFDMRKRVGVCQKLSQAVEDVWLVSNSADTLTLALELSCTNQIDNEGQGIYETVIDTNKWKCQGPTFKSRRDDKRTKENALKSVSRESKVVDRLKIEPTPRALAATPLPGNRAVVVRRTNVAELYENGHLQRTLTLTAGTDASIIGPVGPNGAILFVCGSSIFVASVLPSWTAPQINPSARFPSTMSAGGQILKGNRVVLTKQCKRKHAQKTKLAVLDLNNPTAPPLVYYFPKKATLVSSVAPLDSIVLSVEPRGEIVSITPGTWTDEKSLFPKPTYPIRLAVVVDSEAKEAYWVNNQQTVTWCKDGKTLDSPCSKRVTCLSPFRQLPGCVLVACDRACFMFDFLGQRILSVDESLSWPELLIDGRVIPQVVRDALMLKVHRLQFDLQDTKALPATLYRSLRVSFMFLRYRMKLPKDIVQIILQDVTKNWLMSDI